MRAVAALAAASRSEDRFGVLLLCEPNLADVVTTLLSATLALQQYGKAMVSAGDGPGRQRCERPGECLFLSRPFQSPAACLPAELCDRRRERC
jgi:hypothetical protein